MQKITVLLFLSLLVVACNGRKKTAKSFEAVLEAETNMSHTIVKLETEKGKFTVFQNDKTGEYVAYNLERWNRETMNTMAHFEQVALEGDVVRNLTKNKEWIDSGYWEDVYDTYTYTDEYYDDYCDCYKTETVTESVYVGQTYVDTSHWYYFYTGGGFRFENNGGASKDLDTIAALKEEAAEAFMAHKFKSEFSLSENRAQSLAKLANRYQKLESVRELTSSEKDKFAMEALGVSMNQVEGALKKKADGQEQAYKDLLKTAAQVNNTTPEQIGKFFDEMVDAI